MANCTSVVTKYDGLNYASGILSDLTWIGQIILIIKNRSTKDFSLLTISIYLCCIVLYLTWSLINLIESSYITAGINTLLTLLVLVLKLAFDIFKPLYNKEKIVNIL